MCLDDVSKRKQSHHHDWTCTTCYCGLHVGLLNFFVKNRSSHRRKNLYWSHFLIKLQAWSLIKKILQDRCFPASSCEISNSIYFVEHLQWTSSNDYILITFAIKITNFRFEINRRLWGHWKCIVWLRSKVGTKGTLAFD